MSEVFDYIQRVVSRCGIKREVYKDSSLPPTVTSVKVIVSFNDYKTDLILSTLVLPRVIDRNQYTILLSWPGRSGLYNCVNEYWSLNDEMVVGDVARYIYSNKSSKAIDYEKMLLKYFDNVVSASSLIEPYYKNGLTKLYFDKFETLDYYLPTVPSVQLPSNHLSKGKRMVFLHPSKFVKVWAEGRERYSKIEQSFWEDLTQSLLDKQCLPVLFNDHFSYDLSDKFSHNCICVVEKNILAVLGIMRLCNCVLDVFSGISKYSIIARSPYVFCDERNRYFETCDYVLDDLCGGDLYKDNLFTFSPLLNTTNRHIIDSIVNKIISFIDNILDVPLPSSVECVKTLTYNSVRRTELRRLGSRLLKVSDYEV